MRYLITFIEETVLPAMNKWPVEYDTSHPLIIEDIIEILENQLENDYPVNVHHAWGSLLVDIKIYIEGNELILTIFYDKKLLSFDVNYEGEFLEILNMNKPEFKNDDNNSYIVLSNLVEQIVTRLW